MVVVVVDLLFGVSVDIGQILGVAVQADVIIIFVLYKCGLLMYLGVELAGIIFVVDIGILIDVIEYFCLNIFLIDLEDFVLFVRWFNSYKGYFGHVLVVGGSLGKGGAPFLVGLVVLWSGSGFVIVLMD